MRPSRDEWFLDMAELVGRRATCLRRQVGAVLVNGFGHVLATGYNGRARGLPHCNDEAVAWEKTGCAQFPFACAGAFARSGTKLDACEAIHAEQNALLQCHDVNLIDSCYCPISPCLTCTKLLLNTACRRIVFRTPYAQDSQALWERAGRQWIRLAASK